MLKTIVSGILMSSGLVVGLGSGTIAPEAELPVNHSPNKRFERTYASLHSALDRHGHNSSTSPSNRPASRRVASTGKTGKSRAKNKQTFAGWMYGTGKTKTVIKNNNRGHNWFPKKRLPDVNSRPGSSGKGKGKFTVNGNYVDFATVQDQTIQGGDSEFPTNDNVAYSMFGLGYDYLNFGDGPDGNGNNPNGPIIINDKEAPPVPEPATIVLLGSGLAAYGLRYYRRQRQTTKSK